MYESRVPKAGVTGARWRLSFHANHSQRVGLIDCGISRNEIPKTLSYPEAWVWQPGICPPGSLALAQRSVVARLSRHEGPGLLLLAAFEREERRS